MYVGRYMMYVKRSRRCKPRAPKEESFRETSHIHLAFQFRICRHPQSRTVVGEWTKKSEAKTKENRTFVRFWKPERNREHFSKNENMFPKTRPRTTCFQKRNQKQHFSKNQTGNNIFPKTKPITELLNNKACKSSAKGGFPIRPSSIRTAHLLGALVLGIVNEVSFAKLYHYTQRENTPVSYESKF